LKTLKISSESIRWVLVWAYEEMEIGTMALRDRRAEESYQVRRRRETEIEEQIEPRDIKFQ